jgi:hypothetical protein
MSEVKNFLSFLVPWTGDCIPIPTNGSNCFHHERMAHHPGMKRRSVPGKPGAASGSRALIFPGSAEETRTNS